VNQYFFVTRYLSPDGTYNTQREVDETSADAARQRDLDPDAHFAEADRYRAKTATLLYVLIVFTFAILAFTVSAEGVRGKARYLVAMAGVVLTGAAGIVALLVELGVLVVA
jgi:hypothetical protein